MVSQAPTQRPSGLLFGQIAVKQRFTPEEAVEAGLRRQERMRNENVYRRLGGILVEMGYLTRPQIHTILELQAKLETRTFGDYELLAKLGKGGMGSVFKARDKRTDKIVALKVLPKRQAKDPDYLERFVREAQTSLELDHPNLVKGIELGEAEGYHYLAMEYIEGEDAYHLLLRSGRVSEAWVIDIAIQVAKALDHAQQHGLVHRDIKPDNIIITPSGVAKLTDLGLVRRVGTEPGRLTQIGMAVGTPHYVSPEQAKGTIEVDVRSDIYSLGATIYHLVTGEPPFKGRSAVEVMNKHLNEQLVSPHDINPDLTEELTHIIEKMMAKDPKDRYQTPAELIRDIELVSFGKKPVAVRLDVGKSSVMRAARKIGVRPREQLGDRRTPHRGLARAGMPKPAPRREQPGARTADTAFLWAGLIIGIALIVIAIFIALSSPRGSPGGGPMPNAHEPGDQTPTVPSGG